MRRAFSVSEVAPATSSHARWVTGSGAFAASSDSIQAFAAIGGPYGDRIRVAVPEAHDRQILIAKNRNGAAADRRGEGLVHQGRQIVGGYLERGMTFVKGLTDVEGVGVDDKGRPVELLPLKEMDGAFRVAHRDIHLLQIAAETGELALDRAQELELQDRAGLQPLDGQELF